MRIDRHRFTFTACSCKEYSLSLAGAVRSIGSKMRVCEASRRSCQRERGKRETGDFRGCTMYVYTLKLKLCILYVSSTRENRSLFRHPDYSDVTLSDLHFMLEIKLSVICT